MDSRKKALPEMILESAGGQKFVTNEQMTDFEVRMTNITDEMREILIAKNHDYGDSFGKLFDELGEVVILVRLSDKLNRLKTLLLNKDQQKVDDETVEDTLMDLAGYALLSVDKLRRIEAK